MNPVKNSFLLGALMLAACGPLVKIGETGPAPQRFTLTLTPVETQPQALPPLRVEDLESPAELATLRMAVRVGDQEVRYLPAGQWTDRPARLLRGLIAEALRARSSGLILSPAQIEVVPAVRLTGRLTAFQALAPGSVARTLQIGSAHMLISTRTGAVLASRQFEARAEAASDRPQDLAAAANRAANSLAVQVADWTAAQLAAH